MQPIVPTKYSHVKTSKAMYKLVLNPCASTRSILQLVQPLYTILQPLYRSLQPFYRLVQPLYSHI